MRASQRTIEAENVLASYDAIVIGAGPAGCGAAACLADRGASVLLLESNPKAARRFAGEWIHPEGARVLQQCGLRDGLTPHVEASGFVVCPNDGLGPIRLSYPDDAKGFTCEHETLVTHLRRAVSQKRGVDYVEGARAWPVDAHAVDFGRGGERRRRVRAGRVVLAAGRSARGVDGTAAVQRERVPISSMAGLLLTDAELPVDGFGHVILGGPGPVLAYRIDAQHVRICIDVPQALNRVGRAPEWIWESFAGVLPAGLRASVRRELDRASVSWAANLFRPRRYRTEMGLALVGDVAGVFHPLTAMGITMSLLDAEALSKASSIESYAEERAASTYVPELLSNAIYQAFVRDDAGTLAIRDAIYSGWRTSDEQRERTMRLLGASSTKRLDFVRAFSRVALQAGSSALVHDRRAFAELAGWLRWPWASLHPEPDSIRSRSISWAAPQTWGRADFLRSPEPNEEKRHAI